MRHPFHRHNASFWTPERKRSLYFAVALLAFAVLIQLVAGPYSSVNAVRAHPAEDLLLANLPVVNLDWLIVGGAIFLWAIAWWLLVTHPRYLIFGMEVIALFIICRAFFMNLTYIGPYPRELAPGPNNLGWGLYSLFTFQGNFFFSAHTGFPFLMGLVFWDNVAWRKFFLIMSAVFGAAVLLAHVHYSIDVFAAPFIVYSIYRIGQILFPRDYALIEKAAP